MSMWRKRQAFASDQKSWRALGTDSALWKGIEKNSGNVKAALGGSSTEGIVTGLKIVKTEGVNLLAANLYENTIWVSDASNATIASVEGTNLFDTPHPTSTTGSGLGFSLKRYGTEPFNTQAAPHDLSGIKINILNGGKGYKKNQTFTIYQGTNQYGKETTCLGSTTEAVEPAAGAAVQQEAYKIVTFTNCQPQSTGTDTYVAGAKVTLSFQSGAPDATGFLHADLVGVTSQTITVICELDSTMDSTAEFAPGVLDAQTLSIQEGAAPAPADPLFPCAVTQVPGTETSRKAAVDGFITTLTEDSGGGGAVPDPTFYQTLAQHSAGQFEEVCSKFVVGAQEVISAYQAGPLNASTFNVADAELATVPNDPPIQALVLEGRLSVQVTSITSTKIEPGRN